MDLGIRDKVALVMGGSSGIGRGIAASLAAEGAQVVICARNQDQLTKTGEKIGAVMALQADLSLPGSAKTVIDDISKRLNPVDILVINTGGPPKGFFDQISTEQWQVGFQSLWLSAVDGIKAVLPTMKEKKWGRIIIVSSLSAKEPLKALTVSNGLRAGLSGLVKSVSSEIAASGVTINAILPGYTDTERLRELNIPTEAIVSQIPASRLARTEEVGALAAYLASQWAGYITGQSLMIDGGVTKGF